MKWCLMHKTPKINVKEINKKKVNTNTGSSLGGRTLWGILMDGRKRMTSIKLGHREDFEGNRNHFNPCDCGPSSFWGNRWLCAFSSPWSTQPASAYPSYSWAKEILGELIGWIKNTINQRIFYLYIFITYKWRTTYILFLY